MAGSINIAVYSDALVVLGTAGIVVPMVHRWGFSPVLGYLGAGALLGPLGLGSLIGQLPFLYWFTVVDAKNVSGIADLGVVFLLFLIGLELSYERLKAMRRLVLRAGQPADSHDNGGHCLCRSAGRIGAPIAIMLGACLALSSTAIVLEVLSNQGRLSTGTGRASFAVLLAQDIAVIPLLIFVSTLGADKGGSVLTTVGVTLFHAIAALAFIVVFGRALLRPCSDWWPVRGSSELFIAAILFVIVATGVVAAVADLSMALGAFVAGLLLAETEYRKAVEATIEPFKGLLLGIFFFTVGMGIDFREILREPFLLLACVVGLIALKATILAGLARMFKLSWPVAIETALLLGPGGEFAFVGIGLAATLGLVTAQVSSFTLAVTSLTMATIPLLALIARRLSVRLAPPKPIDPALAHAASTTQQACHRRRLWPGRQSCCGAAQRARHGIHRDRSGSTRCRRHAQLGAGSLLWERRGSGVPEGVRRDERAGVIVTIHSKPVIDEIVGKCELYVPTS